VAKVRTGLATSTAASENVEGGTARPAVLDPGESVQSTRLSLTSAAVEDVEAMSVWLSSALAPDWELPDLETALSISSAVLVRDASGEAIGLAVALVGLPEAGSASVPFLAIAPERRFRGLGGEAGLMLERHLRRKFGIQRVYAPIPDGRGLAVYFWLRLGYRPLTETESPGALIGLTPEARPGIWLVRDVD
jgi:hypothetical protein